MNQSAWLDRDIYDGAVHQYANGLFAQLSAEDAMNRATNAASFDAGFEAGVLAAEAGVGRADA